jgi:hypothetical protein
MNPDPNAIVSYNVYVVYRENCENGTACHVVYATTMDNAVKSMESFYGDDLIAVVFT